MSKTPPTSFRSGPISAAIFENTHEVDGKPRVFSNIRLERSYKDKNDEWQKQVIDLPVRQVQRALLVLEEAQEHVLMNRTPRRVVEKDQDRERER